MSEFNIRGEVNVQVMRVAVAGNPDKCVDVCALRVGGRPVPFDVFPQIPCEPILDGHTGGLRGEPLGWANIFTGECERLEGTGHLHVLWLQDGELRWACVDRDPPAGTDPHAWQSRHEQLAGLPQVFLDC
jgi:hypothetical protein